MLRNLWFYIWHFRHSFGFIKSNTGGVYCLKCGRSTSFTLQDANQLYADIDYYSKKEVQVDNNIKEIMEDIEGVLKDRQNVLNALDTLLSRSKDLEELTDYFYEILKTEKKESARLNNRIVQTKNQLAIVEKHLDVEEDDISKDLTDSGIAIQNDGNESEHLKKLVLDLLIQPGRCGLYSIEEHGDIRWTYTDLYPPIKHFEDFGWVYEVNSGKYYSPNGRVANLYVDQQLISGTPAWFEEEVVDVGNLDRS